jgi:tetratricopeptide (TPR) repeat protein
MRDDFSATVKANLAARVGFLCSNPQCQASTIGPHLESRKTVKVGVAAHICAASPEGPRYDPEQSPEQRRGIDNGIWLCQTCAARIDRDEAMYTPAVLRGWKREAEAQADLRLGKARSALDRPRQFSEQEVELLAAAAEHGEFLIRSSEQAGKCVVVGASEFANPDDPEVAARYLDAFETLRASGLIRYDRGDLYVLTGSGFKVARELRAERGWRIWTVPIPSNPFFTGREQTLANVERSLGSTGKAALTGIGGVGKTQAAVRYAYLRRDEYGAVLWLTGASRQALVSDLATIATRLGLPEMGAEESIAAVKRWLETHEKWLLVLDNADDLGLAENFIPPRCLGHVLLTTQAQATGTVAPAVEVSDMEPAEGAFFLVRRAKLVLWETAPQDVPVPLREIAEAVSEELGGLPLALDQAGAFVEESACGLSTYLDLYRERRGELLERRGITAGGHPDSVAATFALSFEKVEQACPVAADLLRLCAFLSPDAIPEEIFTAGSPGLGANLDSLAGNLLQFNEALGRILRYSLIRRDPSSSTLTIHRLVQAVLQDSMTPDEHRQWADRAVRAVGFSLPKWDFASRAIYDRLIRHAESCKTLIDDYKIESPEGARLLNQAGTYLIERGRFREAEELLDRAVEIANSVAELRPAFLAVVCNNLAAVYQAVGKIDLAEKVNKEVLETRERMLGPDHPDVAQSLNNLATVYMAKGMFKEAKPLLEKALAIKQKVLGPKDPEAATAFNNLGSLYEALADYAKAETAFKRALEIRREVLAADDPDIALTGANLAQLYFVMEKYSEAKKLQPSTEALNGLIGSLGQQHPSVATTLNNCGLLFQTLEEFATAQRCYERAKEIDEKIFGPRHRSYAVSLSNLASLNLERKQYPAAESQFDESLGIMKEALGPDHLDVAKVLSGLGRVYLEQGQLDKAERLSKQSYGIRRMVLGQQHPDVALALINLARVYLARGKYKQALGAAKRAVRLYKRAFGPMHPKVADCYETCAEAFRGMGRESAALACEERARAVRAHAVPS